MSDLNESHIALARITDALFCSDLKIGEVPSRRRLAAAIRRSVQEYRTWNGCTRAVAAAFATNPTAAAERERWCTRVAQDALATADSRLDLDGQP